jgi:hypothetical protein
MTNESNRFSLRSAALLSLVALLARIGSTTPVWAQSVEETADVLEGSISELQDALDEIEGYRSGLEDEDDLPSAVAALARARKTMRMEACSLLLASVEHRRAGDFDRVMSALKIVAPEIFNRSTGRPPERNPTARPKQVTGRHQSSGRGRTGKNRVQATPPAAP